MQQYTISPAEQKKEDSSVEMEPVLQTTTQYTTGETPRTDLVIETPDNKNSEICTKNYTCTCQNCQNEFGALPILLEGIERKSMEERLEPQPSTSSGTTSEPVQTKVYRKFLLCQYCNKSFHHKGDYNKHLRKHTKEKPFKCSVCDRKFSHTSNLQRHLRLHSGQRPFSCKNCLKNFSRKDKLDSHQRSALCQKRSKRK